MWLSKYLHTARPDDSEEVTAGSVTISDAASSLAVTTPDGEKRGAFICTPSGITAVPAVGSNAVSAEVAGDTVLLGCIGGTAQSLELSAGGAKLSLSADGLRLTVNGASILLGENGITVESSKSLVLKHGDQSLDLSGNTVLLKSGLGTSLSLGRDAMLINGSNSFSVTPSGFIPPLVSPSAG